MPPRRAGEARARRPARSAAAASANRLRSRPVVRVDLELAPALRVDEPDRRRRAELPAPADRGSRRRRPRAGPRAAAAARRQSRGPRKSEITTTSARWRASARDPRIACERAASPAAASGSYPSRSASSRPTSPARPWVGGSTRSAPPPKPTSPTRFPRMRRRVSDRQRDAERHVRLAPLGGAERHRRGGVEHDQVTSTRSARWTRTCGSLVRAVTFQSISLTSSPGTYGRTCASSVPRPSSADRWSPASSPSTRRATVSSSALSSALRDGPRARAGPVSARRRVPARTRDHAAAGLPSSSWAAARPRSRRRARRPRVRSSASAW